MLIHRDAELLAKAVAARLVTRLVDVCAARGHGSLVLTGGGIGTRVLAELAAAPARDAVDWRHLDIWWGDERFLPSGHLERNEASAEEALLRLVDTDPEVLGRAAADVAESGANVSPALATGAASALSDGSCDRVASLCTLGFWEGDVLDVARHATRDNGCAAVLSWGAVAPLHERALVKALHEVLGMTSPFLTQCLATPDPQQRKGWELVAVHDVARFDGIGTYWAAMVADRPIAAELARQPDDAIHALRAACQRALESWTAADGTMRIPVEATLCRSVEAAGA